LSLVYGNLASAESNNPIELKLLVYNTHGLPAVFSKDDPVRRFPEIGKQIRRYQLSLLQEDFAHHEALLDSLPKSSVAVRGNKSRFSLCPFCSGSGLTMISDLQQEWKLEIQAEAFNTCSGWLRGLNDCFATKGFQLSRMETPSGKRFFVVNTHLDAGRNASDRQARKNQLKQIVAKVQKEAAGEALIIAGDLNLDWEDPEDRALLETFRKELGLINSGQEVQADRGWPILDYIFYRNGRATTLEVLETGEDKAFKNDVGPLSDHPALFIKLLIY
jgi:hypothetical protein